MMLGMRMRSVFDHWLAMDAGSKQCFCSFLSFCGLLLDVESFLLRVSSILHIVQIRVLQLCVIMLHYITPQSFVVELWFKFVSFLCILHCVPERFDIYKKVRTRMCSCIIIFGWQNLQDNLELENEIGCHCVCFCPAREDACWSWR
jgi:hypothetical protein